MQQGHTFKLRLRLDIHVVRLQLILCFSFLKLVHIFSVNPHLGPLQISLGRMIIDIIKFFFIYSLVLFAFGCGQSPFYCKNKTVQGVSELYINIKRHFVAWTKTSGNIMIKMFMSPFT